MEPIGQKKQYFNQLSFKSKFGMSFASYSVDSKMRQNSTVEDL